MYQYNPHSVLVYLFLVNTNGTILFNITKFPDQIIYNLKKAGKT